MTPLEVATWRRYLRGWQVPFAIADPAGFVQHAKGGVSGCSHFEVLGVAYWMQTTAAGVELRREVSDAAEHLVRWRSLTDALRALPPDVVEQAHALRTRHVEHMAAWVPFSGGPYCGCGRPPSDFGREGPMTAAQAGYADLQEAWHRDHVLPHQAETHRIEAAQHALLDLALPELDDEPADLLDLLAMEVPA